jgi:hypothetical protein
VGQSGQEAEGWSKVRSGSSEQEKGEGEKERAVTEGALLKSCGEGGGQTGGGATWQQGVPGGGGIGCGDRGVARGRQNRAGDATACGRREQGRKMGR